ncbi:hypothetical protein NL676_035391 [Syzygium grande]|nr:hypothetical protein NL676_035391 [Syzygium grande]
MSTSSCFRNRRTDNLHRRKEGSSAEDEGIRFTAHLPRACNRSAFSCRPRPPLRSRDRGGEFGFLKVRCSLKEPLYRFTLNPQLLLFAFSLCRLLRVRGWGACVSLPKFSSLQVQDCANPIISRIIGAGDTRPGSLWTMCQDLVKKLGARYRLDTEEPLKTRGQSKVLRLELLAVLKESFKQNCRRRDWLVDGRFWYSLFQTSRNQ